MQNRFSTALFPALCFFAFLSSQVLAQSDVTKFEVGGFLSAIHMTESTGEGPVGFGGRFSYNFNKYVAFDGDLSTYPQNPSGNFGQTLASAGVKAGLRSRKIGVFAKAKPGVIHFGGRAFRASHNGSRDYFSFDVGGVLEYYSNSQVLVRLDISDNIIDFREDLFNRGFPTPERPGIAHNRQLSFGVSFRF
jgi:hypothetical protein